MAEPGFATRQRSPVITARAAASFDPVPRSVAGARAFVRDTLQGWGFADIVDDAVVLTSELVTNAVIHAGSAAEVLCLRAAEGIRIEVADRYPEREVPLQHPERGCPDPEQESGRHKSAYLPFAVGPRVCIGNHFALMEAQIVLAALTRRVVFESAGGPVTAGRYANMFPVSQGRRNDGACCSSWP